MRALLVEDELYLAEAIQHLLRQSGFYVDIAADGEAGLKFARNDVYDVIILDNMLPKLSGIEILRVLRMEHNSTPILILSAKSDTLDKVEGLEVGADDYLAKPFKTKELIARLQAITRRHKHVKVNTIVYGDITISIDNKTMTSGEGCDDRTNKEYELRKILTSNAGKVAHTATRFRRGGGRGAVVEGKEGGG